MPATFLVDLKNVALAGVSLAPAAAIATATTTNGSAVDLLGAEGPIHALALNGATDYTSLDETYTVKIQESADGSTNWTDISGASGTITAASTVTFISTGLRSKRYVRAVITTVGTTPSIIVGIAILVRKKTVGSGNGAQL